MWAFPSLGSRRWQALTMRGARRQEIVDSLLIPPLRVSPSHLCRFLQGGGLMALQNLSVRGRGRVWISMETFHNGYQMRNGRETAGGCFWGSRARAGRGFWLDAYCMCDFRKWLSHLQKGQRIPGRQPPLNPLTLTLAFLSLILLLFKLHFLHGFREASIFLTFSLGLF